MDALQVVNQFYALNDAVSSGKKGIQDIRALLTDDCVFAGPMMRVEGGDPYAGLLEQFLRFHESLEIVRQWANGNEVCSITVLTLKTPAGSSLRMDIAEWIVVEGGKIKNHTIYYDPRGFAEAFPM